MRNVMQEEATTPLLERSEASGRWSSLLALLKLYMLDWIVILALAGLLYGLQILHPFKRFVGRGMLDDLRYPIMPETVSFVFVPIISLGGPLVAFVAFYLFKRDVHDLHHAVLGLAFSVTLAGVITSGLKTAVGRPRPDFFWRCFPDGKDMYTLFEEVLCSGNQSDIRDGYKSFPSGHVSWCFSGLGYLSLYLIGKLQPFDRHAGKLVIPFLPLAAATYVAVTRIDDYRHHWEDVVVAAILGITTATLSYNQFFPALRDANCLKDQMATYHSEDVSAHHQEGPSNC